MPDLEVHKGTGLHFLSPSLRTSARFVAFSADCLRAQELINIGYLIFTYFQFQFPFFICFYIRLLITYFRFVNCRQRGTSRHTVNGNELRTKAHPGAHGFGICFICGLNRKGDEFIGNKHTNSRLYYVSAPNRRGH